MLVQIHQQEIEVNLNNRKKLKQFIPAIFKKERTPLESLDIIFCSDAFLLDMNIQFLKHNYYTDIITFDLAEEGSPVIGELYISIDRVKDNATIMKVTFQAELHRTIFHGCLHLCGYGDKKTGDKTKMRKKKICIWTLTYKVPRIPVPIGNISMIGPKPRGYQIHNVPRITVPIGNIV